MSATRTTYWFTSWMRRGLSTAIRQPVADTRAKVAVRMSLRGRAVGGGTDTEEYLVKEVELYGPGDVLGFQPDAVIRTHPKSNVGDFEPNYFPFAEFSSDFIWQHTAEPADGDGNLKPWLTLIALVSQDKGANIKAEFTDENAGPGLPRCITVLEPKNSLPDLGQSWRWAHVQVVGGESGDGLLEKALDESPARVVSRLLCARRLLPGTRYSAFLVPTFELGRLAGLGIKPENPVGATTLSWDRDGDYGNGLRIPYYYRWDFGTGLRGDFERMVRLLEPRRAEEINGLGTRPMDCGRPGFGVASVEVGDAQAGEDHILGLEGALEPVLPDSDEVYTKWGRDAEGTTDLENRFRQDLQGLLNETKADITQIPHEFTKPPDTSVITNVVLAPLESPAPITSIRVTWSTASPMTSVFEFYKRNESDAAPVSETDLEAQPNPAKEHELIIRGLEPGAVYGFRVGGVDAQQATRRTQWGTITMPPLPTVAAPIYGRWHAAKDQVNCTDDGWLHELNLDPRHRAAAGFGAEVVRQQQESLMAEAWDQLGEVEKANNLLRRAQLAREGMNTLWRRIGALKEGTFLQLTAPVHSRVRFGGARGVQTLPKKIRVETQIPRASLAPAFRRIARPHGALRRRQAKPWTRDVVQELARGTLRAAGPRQALAGMVDMEAVTVGLASQLAPGSVDAVGGASPGGAPMLPASLSGLLNPHLQGATLSAAIDAGAINDLNLPNSADIAQSMQVAIDTWLNREPPAPTEPVPSAQYLSSLKRDVTKALDPRESIRKHAWSRIKVADIQTREDADPLDEIMWAPTFNQPMYEPLRAISQDLILPGLKKVPQNTVLVLKTNRRFMESYKVGVNHEMASEFLWREYPTDQRGTYFRQFWDVRDRVPGPGDPLDEKQLEEKYRDIGPIHLWKDRRLGTNSAANAVPEQLVVLLRADLFKKYPDTIVYAVNKVSRVVDETSAGQPLVPALREYLKARPENEGRIDDTLTANPPIFPIFRGDLPADISFFGFPFTEEEAANKCLVIEQSVAGSAARFGLDMPQEDSAVLLKSWSDLAWDHFEAPDDREGGWYLDNLAPNLDNPEHETPNNWWRNGNSPTSAQIAHVTMQLPVRIAIEFSMLLPQPVAN